MLYQDFMNHTGKIIHKPVHYFPVYERFFTPFQNKSLLMFEIGVSRGGSLQLWKKFFGPFAVIVGIDIDESCLAHADEQCRVRIGSQADMAFLKGLVREFGAPDIVLDDGSHRMADMAASFDFLYPLLNDNGVYVVEDAHTCYWDEFDGGLGREGSFMEKAKKLLDSLNAWHIRDKDMVDEFTRSTFGVSFFDSMVVFEKKRHPKPYARLTGERQARPERLIDIVLPLGPTDSGKA